jgi:cobalt-zinc-cadmium efflux system protein
MHSHGHGHDHSHDHGHHHHGSTATSATRRALTIALQLTAVILIAEVVGGFAFHSLALLSDAAHMLTDVAAYALALLAWWLAQRPATETRTYGFARAEILAALANGATLVAVSAWIVIEATHRLSHPESVKSGGVIVIASIGLVCNIIAMAVLTRADKENLNVRGAVLHTMADAGSSAGVILAAIVISVTGWNRVDAIVSYAIAALVLWGSWRLVRESVDVLLDSVPSGMRADEIANAMLECSGVTEVHDLHVWGMGSGTTALSAHVRLAPGSEVEQCIDALSTLLRDRFHIEHSTIQPSSDRSQQPLDAIGLMPMAEAIEWANEHIVRTYPHLSRGAVAAATGAAAVAFNSSGPVSPVALSRKALNALEH